MKESNLLVSVTTREQFRAWLNQYATVATECWLPVKKGRTAPEGIVLYLDAVEEALCFGWIDSTCKTVNGRFIQRFSPRKEASNWTELNKERCRRLLKLGRLTDKAFNTLPDLQAPFVIFPEVEEAFRQRELAWTNFQKFHPLYQRVRIDKIHNEKNRGRIEKFYQRLEKLIAASEQNKMIGDWNDYGRLLCY